MLLHEALSLLKEDGSNWIKNEGLYRAIRIIKIRSSFYIEVYDVNECAWNEISCKQLPTDNWELHQEPKFKVGQPVALISDEGDFSLYFICKYDEKKGRYGLAVFNSTVVQDDYICQTKEENLLSMAKLAEKLGDK